MKVLLVALGGALGSVARYGVGELARRFVPGFPWGTLAVNVIGGVLMGLVAGRLAEAPQEDLRVFAAVGVLGGFTTFSAFSLESAQFIQRRELGLAAGYVGSSVALSIAAIFVGLFLARAGR